MGFTTIRDIITKSLKEIGIGAEGETLSAEMLNDGLNSLNLLLSLWGARSLMTTAEIAEIFPLTALQESYLMGVNSIALPTDFNTTKPSRIISAFVRNTGNNFDYPLKLISRDEYNNISLKNIYAIPELLVQDPGATQQTNQVITLYLYPGPDASATYNIHLFSEKPLTWVSSLNDSINVENIYISAMVYNLALEIAPEYGITLHKMTIKKASDNLNAIEIINSAQKRPVVNLDLPKPEKADWTKGG